MYIYLELVLIIRFYYIKIVIQGVGGERNRMKKLLLFLIGGILLIGTYGCANYEEDLLDEISPKQMLATVTTEIELADAVYHRDTVLDPAAE